MYGKIAFSLLSSIAKTYPVLESILFIRSSKDFFFSAKVVTPLLPFEISSSINSKILVHISDPFFTMRPNPGYFVILVFVSFHKLKLFLLGTVILPYLEMGNPCNIKYPVGKLSFNFINLPQILHDTSVLPVSYLESKTVQFALTFPISFPFALIIVSFFTNVSADKSLNLFLS